MLVARCPAKVNLHLQVIGRRPDGFHQLDTIFQAIDVWDTLEARPADELSLECPGSDLPGDESNLVLRAAVLLRDRFAARTKGAALVLRKKIPVEAGLGGGSSDAAAALLLCERLWGLDVGDGLADLGRELGADVPFFLTGGTAHGTGRGDHIRSIPFAGRWPILLGLAPFGVPTRDVFAALGARLTPPAIDVSLPLLLPHKWHSENDFGRMANDLEEVVFEGWPELMRFRDALREAGARRALLSGSGSTVFGVFAATSAMEAAMRTLRERFPRWTLMPTRAVETAAHVEDGD